MSQGFIVRFVFWGFFFYNQKFGYYSNKQVYLSMSIIVKREKAKKEKSPRPDTTEERCRQELSKQASTAVDPGYACYLGTTKVVESYWHGLGDSQLGRSACLSCDTASCPTIDLPFPPEPSLAQASFPVLLSRSISTHFESFDTALERSRKKEKRTCHCTPREQGTGDANGETTCSLRRGDGSAATGRPSPWALGSSARATW